MVVQVDADTMNVLGMLKQEPGAGKGLLTAGADVAGWLIFICGPRKINYQSSENLTVLFIFTVSVIYLDLNNYLKKHTHKIFKK